ncbi:hypothetical protein ACXZ66_06860 [Corynebacterium sp. S7]
MSKNYESEYSRFIAPNGLEATLNHAAQPQEQRLVELQALCRIADALTVLAVEAHENHPSPND